MKTYIWTTNYGLWVREQTGLSNRLNRSQQVGYIYKTKKGTYWCAVLFMGNVRAAAPTEQEARDLLLLLAKANEG
jgi:hypothetical protein